MLHKPCQVDQANACDIVDYNSWVESPEGLALGKKLDKNVIIVEGKHVC